MADVFIGTTEIVNIGAIYQRELEGLGFSVHSHMFEKNPYFTHEVYNVVRGDSPVVRFGRLGRWIQKPFDFVTNLNHRCYIYIFGSSLTGRFRRQELALLKQLGKMIVAIFCGCDIRHWSSCEAEFQQFGYIAPCHGCESRKVCSLDHKLATIHDFEMFADHIYSVRSQSQLLTRPYHNYWAPIELSAYQYHVPKNVLPRVVHAPTDSSMKGTQQIEAAMESLHSIGYRFEYIRLENLNNIRVREVLSSADILVDQLGSVMPGTLALEGMASGCAVLAGCKPEYAGIPPEVPVLDTGPDTIYVNLKYLLDHREIIPDLARRGREYVEKYHDSRHVVRNLAETIGLVKALEA